MAPVFTPKEQKLIASLRTPRAVQRYLDGLAYNYETHGESLRSFRGVVRAGRAHCLEGALFAATVLEQHGHAPLLLDLESVDLLDHVLFVFKEGGRWGTVGRSRDPGLHGRKPVFESLRALVASYVAPYVDLTGRIMGYGVLDLRTLTRTDWRCSTRNVWKVEQALIDNDHKPFRTKEAEYQAWLARYKAFKARYPDRKPVYYPGRGNWLSAGPRVA